MKKQGQRAKKKFIDIPFAYHQEITLRIDDLTNLGDGIYIPDFSFRTQFINVPAGVGRVDIPASMNSTNLPSRFVVNAFKNYIGCLIILKIKT